MADGADATTEREIVAQTFPERAVTSVRTVQRGNHKQTAVVEFAEAASVVVQWSTRPAALRTEFTLAAAVRERTSLPVPAVLAAGELDGVGYVVCEHAEGVDLHEEFAGLAPEHQHGLARRFGRCLAELHEAFRFEGYGRVHVADDEGTGTVATVDVSGDQPLRAVGSTDWEAWFSTYAREGLAALPAVFDEERAAIKEVLATADLPTVPTPRLYPWDLRPGNALVADGELTAVLDWGDPLAADAGLSLAKAEYVVCDWYVEDGAALRAALHEGYESIRPVPTVPLAYRLVAVARSAVDSRGVVTRPGFPEREGDAAVAFHKARLGELLAECSE
ncbi:Fructosamine-3-kinase [Halogranum gelatinilyticum]|uniref:Fructosamine-3-kinase n=1 Tax=Halogranum gelatinilyticum TaxID=660521 RepID=A0A1G9TE46_9EURY|nr:phosphotransferase [Halogranum gelatinilyticum]SDM45913.1 Fructosamine-3-kinase [Halogranum gelatinilyticum]